ncbi:DUF397 domain-containing protein [Streptomyces sp. SID3343]|uniref:DUF397 domain-containing protein n=1 Tax=Streptomyces sp. SID3343 TaxID=2690260 RepID=UPI00136D5088|nr:DUF397 domain-containing protein [Streptomyces sp. SID3343]MYW06070.1 DUF397 domain-containing protein [Streptomyces sp. SID3343]
MNRYRSGAPAASFRAAEWIKSSASTATGNCVELAALSGGDVAVRNSRDPQGPALVYSAAEITAFFAATKAGEFDRLIE